jgi:hypothetical protein
MDTPTTLPFEQFWRWVQLHPNCILRAGTPEAVLYDDDDLHWHFAAEEGSTLVVQVLRGKRLLGEIILDPEQLAYVEVLPGDVPEEFVFELVAETEQERFAPYFFVFSHGLDETERPVQHRVH